MARVGPGALDYPDRRLARSFGRLIFLKTTEREVPAVLGTLRDNVFGSYLDLYKSCGGAPPLSAVLRYTPLRSWSDSWNLTDAWVRETTVHTLATWTTVGGEDPLRWVRTRPQKLSPDDPWVRIWPEILSPGYPWPRWALPSVPLGGLVTTAAEEREMGDLLVESAADAERRIMRDYQLTRAAARPRVALMREILRQHGYVPTLERRTVPGETLERRGLQGDLADELRSLRRAYVMTVRHQVKGEMFAGIARAYKLTDRAVAHACRTIAREIGLTLRTSRGRPPKNRK